MSQDLKLKNYDGLFDLEIDSATKTFKTVDGMETGISVTLFTDARAPGKYVKDASERRGYVGDIIIKRSLGSLLWTYEQVRLTQEVMNNLRADLETAFAPMRNLKQLSNIEIDVTKKSLSSILIDIKLYFTDNRIERYKTLWSQTKKNGD